MASQKKNRVLLAPVLEKAGRRYRKKLRALRIDFSPEAIHDLRVETRRLLALCELFKGLKAGPPLGKLRRRLKKRLSAFSKLRDVQVQIGILCNWPGEALGAFSDPSALLTLLVPQLENQEVELIAELRRETRSLSPGPVLSKLRTLKRVFPETTSQRLIGVLRRTERETARKFSQIRASAPESFHAARIALKRLRYQAELVKPWVVGVTERRLLRLQAQQDALGAIQDLDAWIRTLKRGLKQGRYPHHITHAVLEQSTHRLEALCTQFCRTRATRFAGFGLPIATR
jgi:CHAD domain-containing protein